MKWGYAMGGVALAVSACNGGASGTAPEGWEGVSSGLTAASTSVTSTLSDGGPTPVARLTTSGIVVGRSDGTVASFLGIPYAAPPTGALRWRPPVPATPWIAPRDASTLGTPCPQIPALTGGSFQSLDEDCLTVNVWTPAHARRPGPVMVFLHGGGWLSDTGSSPLYDGTHFAQNGVVLVTLNHRLGQLGFLAHPALSAEDPLGSAGNYGLLDEQLALRWVRANIGAFGGDPDEVTLFGNSSGAIDICAHLVIPSSAGLFRHAVQESGTCSALTMPLRDTPGLPYQSAQSLGLAFASAIGCDAGGDVAACMRGKAVFDVLTAAPRNLADLLLTSAHYIPNIDGVLLPAPPWALLQAGLLNGRSWIGGATRDDGSGFAAVHSEFAPLSTEADYEAALGAIVPGHATDAAALYPLSVFGSPIVGYSFFVTDAVFTCPARREAQWLRTHHAQARLYQFSRVNGFGVSSGLGAFHGTELPYVFDNFVPPFTEDATDAALSPVVMGAWARFATHGNPNGGSLPDWPLYDSASDDFMQFADTASLQHGLHAPACDIIGAWVDQAARDEALALSRAAF